MASDDLIILGTGNLQRRDRTNAAGVTKSRYTVQVSGESVLVNTNAKALGKAPAEAMAKVLREKVLAIAAVAAPATIRAREAAQKALSEGKTWATKRYAGGRIGMREPNQSNRLFNDSGRMAESIAVGETQYDYWVVNVAANRLDPNTLNGGQGALTRIYQRLGELVPEFRDAAKLLAHADVAKAIGDGLRQAMQKADERTLELKQRRMQAWAGLLRLVA